MPYSGHDSKHDEFFVLFRYNLMKFLNIYNVYNPNKYDMTVAAFDDLSSSYNKLTRYIDLSYGEKINIDLIPVKVGNLFEKAVATLADIKNFGDLKSGAERLNSLVAETENKLQEEQSDAYAEQKFNGMIFDILYENSMVAKQDTVDSGIRSLLKECGIPAEFYPTFYRSIIHNKHNSEIILGILKSSCHEYINQPSSSREELEVECVCKKRNGKNSYSRKSFALMVALDSMSHNNDARALSVYECPENENVWHITHEPKVKNV